MIKAYMKLGAVKVACGYIWSKERHPIGCETGKKQSAGYRVPGDDRRVGGRLLLRR